MLDTVKNKKDYKETVARFEEIREAQKGRPEYKEMMLLPL